MEWILLLLAIIWIVGIVKGYRHLTKTCQYSDIVAVLIVWFLGPFSLLLSPSGKPCPRCRSLIDPKATVCPKCTRDVSPAR